MKKIALLSMIVLMTIVTTVSANSFFNTGITAIHNQIYSNESASYDLSIYSSSARIETFSIYTDVEWSLTTIPAEDKNFRVYPNSMTQTTVLLKPKNEARILPGAYAVRIYLRNHDTSEVITNNVILHIKGPGGYEGNYLPSIRAEVSLDKQIDPREPIKIRVLLENQNPLEITSLELFLQSDLFTVQDLLSLNPLEKKEIFYSAPINPKQSPTADQVKLTLRTDMDGRIYEFNSVPFLYTIIEYGKVVEQVSVEKEFLKRTITYTLDNTANTPQVHEFLLRRSIIKAPFNSFSEPPVLKKIGKIKHYSWEEEIPVSQQHIIIEKINYRPLALTLLAIAILILLYAAFRSPVLIRKSMVVTQQRHGGIAGITVQIDIKNRSSRTLSHLRIKDMIPNMFRIEKDFEIGTLHPYQILNHERKGTIVKWKVDDIEPFEERIITFRLTSKLNIIGRFSLPQASLTYQEGDKNKIIHSNKVFMSKR